MKNHYLILTYINCFTIKVKPRVDNLNCNFILQLDKAMNNSVTFIIVRHPFERLLSGYRDKIMFALPHTLHDKLGIRIVRKYRKYVSARDDFCFAF